MIPMEKSLQNPGSLPGDYLSVRITCAAFRIIAIIVTDLH